MRTSTSGHRHTHTHTHTHRNTQTRTCTRIRTRTRHAHAHVSPPPHTHTHVPRNQGEFTWWGRATGARRVSGAWTLASLATHPSGWTLVRLAAAHCGARNKAWSRGEGPRDIVQKFDSRQRPPAVGSRLRRVVFDAPNQHRCKYGARVHVVCVCARMWCVYVCLCVSAYLFWPVPTSTCCNWVSQKIVFVGVHIVLVFDVACG